MNAEDVLKYGHNTARTVLDAVPETEWETRDVCGWWSVRHIVAHLASYEHLLIDVLNNLLGNGTGPTLSKFLEIGIAFNDAEVDRRDGWSSPEVLTDYINAQAETMKLIKKIPIETRRKVGNLPWYGEEYDLEDLITYQYYGHKREHMAQVGVFLDLLKAQEKL